MVAPLIREWCVMISMILHHLAVGFVLSYPAVLTPAITAGNTNNDTDVRATKGEASWIAAAFSMTGGVGFLLLPPLMQIYGRRFINVVMNLVIFIGWVIIALSPNVPTIIAGRTIQGLSFGGLYICSILAGEYSHPKRRGFFIIFKISATGIGELICHGFGFSLSWRQMAWLASAPPALAALGTVVWPESPQWLAYKGRFDECVTSFEWLRGNDMEAQKELKEMITAQQELRNMKKLRKSGALIRNLQAMKSKEFLKPFTVVLMLIILTQVCGRHYLLAYVVQIMISLTGDKSQAYYYTIGLDVMKILAVLTTSYFVRIYKRRHLLLYSSIVACVLLSLVCLFHLWQQKGILTVTWLTPLLLILYNIVCYLGVIPVSMVLKGELLPIEYKGLGTSVLGIFYALSSMILIKSTSIMLDAMDAHGTFGVYTVIAVICIGVLYFILPETKDRTLQDIELEFVDIKMPKEDNLEMRTVANSKLMSVS
ncbi:facilitated trehalose transporter Tret1-like [Spodoptera litura]|uniref:Facilitated trehalose transporter Tret1-like n=1 Tax=Spodoptera litura TaxID=69820 RepID=A0A9J7E8E0_SPOLT|nr:facilitated trehalose transporter Tret1-like [Spodoptera litura]